MNIAITTRGYKAPERLKSYIDDKKKRLSRFENMIMGAETKFSYEKLEQIVEFTVKLKHKTIRITEKSEDVYKTLDLAFDKMEQQIAKAKDKLKDHGSTKIVEKLEN